jgi:hypothetical protein
VRSCQLSLVTRTPVPKRVPTGTYKCLPLGRSARISSWHCICLAYFCPSPRDQKNRWCGSVALSRGFRGDALRGISPFLLGANCLEGEDRFVLDGNGEMDRPAAHLTILDKLLIGHREVHEDRNIFPAVGAGEKMFSLLHHALTMHQRGFLCTD